MSKLRYYHGNYGGKSIGCTWYTCTRKSCTFTKLHNWHIPKRSVTFIMNFAIKKMMILIAG